MAAILWTIGIILAVVGAVLLVLGSMGRAVGGPPALLLTDEARGRSHSLESKEKARSGVFAHASNDRQDPTSFLESHHLCAGIRRGAFRSRKRFAMPSNVRSDSAGPPGDKW